MSTKQSASSTALVNIEGRLSFEMIELCASWTVEQRYVMLYQRDDGSETQINTFLSSWEKKTGDQYKFFVKRDESDGVEKVIEGKGIVPKNKAGGNVKFLQPEPKQITLNKLRNVQKIVLLISNTQGVCPKCFFPFLIFSLIIFYTWL